MDRLRRFGSTRQRRSEVPTSAWFDHPGALSEIPRRATNPRDEATLTSWVQNGYAIVEQVIPHQLIDAMLADLDGLFVADEAIDGISFDDLTFDDGSGTPITHRELLQRPIADRLAARDASAWRLHAFFCYSAAADAVRRDGELGRIASMILGVDSDSHYSINFHNGSQQEFHEDAAVFHLRVPTLICGAWIACEDIVEGSGPLLYCPGSHRRPLFPFAGYPLANLQTADDQTAAAYHARVSSRCGRLRTPRVPRPQG